MILQLLKFIIIGFSGLIIDFLITFLCKEKIKLNGYISNSIGFSFAACSNYFINRIWTFKSINTEILNELSSFFLIAIIGLIINNIILYSIINQYRINFYFAKLIAIILTTLWNFFGNFYITFQI